MLLATIAKLLLYAGVTLVAGELSLRIWRVFAVAGTSPLQVRRSVHGGWLALWGAVALLLLVQARDLELGRDAAGYVSLVTGTAWGQSWLLLAGSVLAGHVAFAARWPFVAEVAAVAVLALAMGGLGHPAADAEWPLASRALDMVHVLGVSVWLGGLYFVSRFAPHEHQADAWSAFSRVATVAAPLVVLTGFGAALRRVGGVGAGTTIASDYGRLLLIKLALAFVVLGFGAMHRQRTVERRLPGARTVHAELAFAALVFLVTSVLTGTAPPGE